MKNRSRIARWALLNFVGLWAVMALQPCFAASSAPVMASPPNKECAQMDMSAAQAPCGQIAKLDCELPDRGPITAAVVHNFYLGAALVPLSQVILMPTHNAVRIIPRRNFNPLPHASPPLRLQHCVFRI